jgi:hypothetical protein
VPCGGGPCVGQLDPEHCGVLIAAGLLALPPPHPTTRQAVKIASTRPLIMAYDMLLSPFRVIVRSNFAARLRAVN